MDDQTTSTNTHGEINPVDESQATSGQPFTPVDNIRVQNHSLVSFTGLYSLAFPVILLINFFVHLSLSYNYGESMFASAFLPLIILFFPISLASVLVGFKTWERQLPYSKFLLVASIIITPPMWLLSTALFIE